MVVVGAILLFDERQMQVTYSVAHRLAITEASIWRQFGHVEHKEPTLKQMQGSKAAAAKRQLEDAIGSATGKD